MAVRADLVARSLAQPPAEIQAKVEIDCPCDDVSLRLRFGGHPGSPKAAIMSAGTVTLG